MVDRDDGVFRSAARDAPAGAGSMAAFGGDGFELASLVVLITRCGVFGGDGKASRVTRNFEAVAAVGADSDLLRGIDIRPYPSRGNDAALCGVSCFGRGDDFALYSGCVGFGGLCFWQRATSTEGEQQCHR